MAGREAHAEGDGLTEIERQRLANIRRNQEVLQQAGLGGSRTLLGRRKGAPAGGADGDDGDDETSRKRRAEAAKRKKAPPRPPTEPTRRSLRNLGKEAPDYREAPDIRPTVWSAGDGRPQHRWAEGGGGEDGQDLGPGEAFDAAAIEAARQRAVGEAPAPAPGSSRTMDADVGRVLGEYLGRKVPFTGKQCVMDLLTPPGAGYAKFSKYAGVVEWRNAIVLWVNVDGSDYENLFLQGGREMTWFAGSRATAETPVILRLLASGRPPEASSGGDDAKEDKKKAAAQGGQKEQEQEQADEILLFCRLTGEPYVCMGRVHHVWHETRRHPIKMVWQLRDFDAIKNSADVKEVLAGGGVEEEEEQEDAPKGGKEKKKEL